MDIVFSLDVPARANFLQAMIHSLNCTYICVWSYLPQPSNCCLLNLDGLYREDNTQPSSSSGGFDRMALFNEYKKLIINVENNFVPGHAFKNSISYLELQESELQTHSSAQIQRQFYSAARIKSSVFMGSSEGEIELGFSYISQVNMAEKMKQLILFPTWQDSSSMEVQQTDDPQFENLPPSSSSSSLKSLSMGSPESSPLFYNFPTVPHFTQSASLLNPMQPKTPPYLAALPSPRSSSSASSSQHRASSKASAFQIYATLSGLPQTSPSQDHRRRRQSMLKQSITFYRNLNLMRIRERIEASRPTATQLLHMISERKRREKLNQSFQALRSLLPSGTKKDKATVLATTRQHLTKLKAQVSELNRKNQLLEAQILPTKDEETSSSSIHESFNVRVSPVSESTSSDEGQLLDLEISVRAGNEGSLMADMAIRVLQFLKGIANVRVLSINGSSQMPQSSSLSRLSFRLSIQDGEWDRSAFQEAVRRMVSDLAPPCCEGKHNRTTDQ